MSNTPSARILKGLLPKGCRIERAGRGGHLRIYLPSGELLRDCATGMPVSVSSSPSNKNWIREVRKSLIDAGIYPKGANE